MRHIPRDHYGNLNFDANKVWVIRNIEWLWDTYGALRQHDMFESFCNDPKALKCMVKNHGTEIAMGYLKPRKVKVCKRVTSS